MNPLFSALRHLTQIENLALGTGPVHRRHPFAKMLVVLGFLLAVASFGKYDAIRLTPMLLPLYWGCTRTRLPGSVIRSTWGITLPFVLMLGIANPLLDPHRFTAWGFSASAGWLSLLTLLLKAVLTVTPVLLLAATTGPDALAQGLRTARIPEAVVQQSTLLYRYLSVLLAEAQRLQSAYALRDPAHRGIRFEAWGPLMGQWLLRSLERAERVHQAMVLRGFEAGKTTPPLVPFTRDDARWTAMGMMLILFLRVVDLPRLFNHLTQF